MVEILNMLLLAVVQGLTEFLPVSSSGHLVLFQHFMGVADVMRAEAHEKIEAHFQVFKHRMEKREGLTPTLVIREGDKIEEVITHITNDPEIGVLVLGAGTGKRGPGPLISALTGRRMADVHVPITIVPGSMTKDEIIAVS